MTAYWRRSEPAYGNSANGSQVAITLLGTCRFWELPLALLVATGTFWFKEVREAEVGYYQDRVPAVILPSLFYKDRERMHGLSRMWTPGERWWNQLHQDWLLEPQLTDTLHTLQ